MPTSGLAQAILKSQIEVFASAAPQYKISPMGLLGYMLNQASPSILSSTIDDKTGYIKDVSIRSMIRAPQGTSVTVDDCSMQTEPAFQTQTMPALLKRYKGFWLDIPTVKQFTADALASTTIGNPPTATMKFVMDALMANINGLLMDINIDCMGQIVFGKNVANGLTTAKTYNFPQATTTLLLNTGMNEIEYDARLNETNIANLSFVAAGNLARYLASQRAMGVAANGLNTSGMTQPTLYFDPYATTAWGANEFAMIEKDAVQFLNVSYNRATAISGPWGSSNLGVMTFPVNDSEGQSLRTLEFDLQVIEVDCPADQVIADYDSGTAHPKGRGAKVIIGCHYAPVQIPITAYAASDRMTGVRGIWRGLAANT